ncbi:MAG: MFS transporter [Anaerolineales bacterium]|nr:MFS transporter [Anaerolineales bacterium]
MRILSLKQAFATPWQRTLYIIFIGQLITAVGFSSIFPFLPLYVESLGSSTGLSIELLAGLVFSAQAFTMMIASPFWGMLADRHGRKLMVERSMFGGAGILLLMAFVNSAEQLVILRAIQGLITGTLAAANALVASVTPRERMGYAMGLLQVAVGIGVALGPLIGGAVADAFGYSASFFITSALLFLAGILVLFGVQENFVPTEDSQGRGGSFLARWGGLLSMEGVKPTYGLRFMSQLARMMIIPILPLFVLELLIEDTGVNTFTGLVIGVGAAATTLSAVYLGRLGDRVGHRRVLVVSAFSAALLYLPSSWVTEGWQLLVLYGLIGVAMGGIIPAISALLVSYTLPGEEGAVYGLDNSIRAGARSLAPLIGSSVALWFGMRSTFLATSLLFFIAGLLAIWRLPKPTAEAQATPVETQTRHW